MHHVRLLGGPIGLSVPVPHVCATDREGSTLAMVAGVREIRGLPDSHAFAGRAQNGTVTVMTVYGVCILRP